MIHFKTKHLPTEFMGIHSIDGTYDQSAWYPRKKVEGATLPDNAPSINTSAHEQ